MPDSSKSELKTKSKQPLKFVSAALFCYSLSLCNKRCYIYAVNLPTFCHSFCEFFTSLFSNLHQKRVAQSPF